jgi:hypothetical protein
MKRRLALLSTLALCALGGIGAASASAATVWNLEMHHNQTNFSSSMPGAIGVRTITEGSASASEVQEITLSAEAGKFTLGFNGDTTPELAFNAGNAVVQSALRALPSIGGTNVKTQREASGTTITFIVTFQGALANTDVPQILAAEGTPPLTLAARPQYWFDLDNVGSSASSGEIDLTVELPAGLTLANAITKDFEFNTVYAGELDWSCTGTSTVECKTTDSVPRHAVNHLILEVSVDPGLPEGVPLAATATLEGGGAAKAAVDAEPAEISSAPAPFGIVASSFVPDFFQADGIATEREAGAHPDLLKVPVDFNTLFAPTPDKPNLKREAESVRNLSVDLPPGFIGNPTAIEECTAAQYTVGACPPSSQVGRFDGSVYPIGAGLAWNFSTGVFNLVHSRGAVTDLGFQVAQNPVHVKASLDPSNRYAIISFLPDINETLPPFSGKVTIWGIPADKSHDSERCKAFAAGLAGNTSEECSTDHPPEAFISLPAQCESPNVFRFHEYDSWQNTGLPNANPDVDYTMPGLMTDCEKPRFEPEVSLEPTGKQANTPTGLNVAIHVPQNENPNGVATPPVRSTVVTLPQGMTVNPGFADGLQGCSEAQFGISHQGVPNEEAIACPDNSRIGEVTVDTPLLPKPIEGSMYLAKQEANPFGSLLALYLALHDTEERGVLVKVPGKIDLNPSTGQITTSFDDLPQFPFEDLSLKFRSGERAPLINPPSCGAHRIEATMTSYARPNEEVGVSGSYQVTQGPDGGPCQASPSLRPFDPQLIGGTLNPLAGAFSPMNLRVFRTDADQELSSAEGTSPPGLVASVRGVGRCTDAQIAAASARSHPGQGALELLSPSCPANSQIGTLEAGAGAGPSPIYVPGKIYLAGPYKGAPLSGVAIVPAIAGPVDLGNVVVRAPAFLDPRTAQVSLKSDPLPQIIDGVLIRTRDVRIHLDRPNFSLNPTSCDPMSIDATLHSTEGATKNDSERFQVGSCASLGFKPKLSLKLKGGTKRGGHPALKAVVTPREGDANFASAVVTLPHSAFLDQAHIRTICTRVQFAAGQGNGAQCPAGAIYGQVKAWTPLLDEPLTGEAILRSSNHNLPDLVFALHGPPSLPIQVELASRIDSRKGGIRSSFEAIPDVPVSRFILEMQGAKKGLIVNSTDICKGRHRANADLGGQNGKAYEFGPVVGASGCGKAKRGNR